jgi:hypothetical protein
MRLRSSHWSRAYVTGWFPILDWSSDLGTTVVLELWGWMRRNSENFGLCFWCWLSLLPDVTHFNVKSQFYSQGHEVMLTMMELIHPIEILLSLVHFV